MLSNVGMSLCVCVCVCLSLLCFPSRKNLAWYGTEKFYLENKEEYWMELHSYFSIENGTERKSCHWKFYFWKGTTIMIWVEKLLLVYKNFLLYCMKLIGQEERDIISFLDMDLKNPWRPGSFNGLNSTKCYGLRINLGTR